MEKKSFLNNFIGDKKFYKKILLLALPIMIQNGITNFVNMLDNVMVGKVGTLQMSGVAITNQLIFVFNLLIFGALSGAGIFGAQFFGKGDKKGIQDTFRFKIICGVLLTVLAIILFLLFGNTLISFYLNGDENPQDAIETLLYGKEYLLIMLVGLLPYTVTQCYSSTLREVNKAVLPMTAGVIAVLINLFFNWVLIFGKLGAPALGIKGAAIATVISRFVELVIVVIGAYRGENYFKGALKTLTVPFDLVKRISVKGLPLVINETMWAAGMAMLNQCYSVRGISVVAATNITQTFFNVFSVVFISVGAAIGIILGQILGSKNTDGAMLCASRLITFSVFTSVIVGAIFFVCADYIPFLYNTTDEVKEISAALMKICAVAMPLDAFAHASYFTLRAGGRIVETVLFDSGFVWAVNVTIAFVLSRFTGVGILTIYALCQFTGIIRCVIGTLLVKKGLWIKNIVE